MIPVWSMVIFVGLLFAGCVFSALIVAGLARSASGADREWQLARIERKLDLILTHLGLAHDDHVPDRVVEMVRAGKKLEAIREYRALTGSSMAVAKREVDYVETRLANPDKPALDDDL